MLGEVSVCLAKFVYGVSCQDGSVPGAVKLAIAGAVVSLVGVVGGALCLGLGFFPPVAMIGILAGGAAGLVAGLAFIISRFGKISIPDLSPQSSMGNAPTPPSEADPHVEETAIPRAAGHLSVEKLPEINIIDGEKPPERVKLSLELHGTGFHASLRHDIFAQVDTKEGDDAAFLERVKERFSGIVPEFKVCLSSSEELRRLLECEKLHRYITSIAIGQDFKIGNDAAAELFIQMASSFPALRAININNFECVVDGNRRVHTSEVVLATISPIIQSDKLRKVTLQAMHNIELKEIGPNVDSISFECCSGIDAKSVLESRRWKKITLNYWGLGLALNFNLPKEIITEELRTSIYCLRRSPQLLECFCGVSKLTLNADGDELSPETLAPLLKYGRLREIILINKFGTMAPAALLETIGKLPQLKKLTVSTPLSEQNRCLKSPIITEDEKQVLLSANPNLRIIVETTQPDDL
jgi:hypothetical protein